jgi:hypothetical protein
MSGSELYVAAVSVDAWTTVSPDISMRLGAWEQRPLLRRHPEGLSGVALSVPDDRAGGRKLPELCANGTGVTAVGVTESGTSFASPAVAGKELRRLSTALATIVDLLIRSYAILRCVIRP